MEEKEFNISFFRVVEDMGEDINVLSCYFKTYEKALAFKNKDFTKKYHPNAYIIAEIKNE